MTVIALWWFDAAMTERDSLLPGVRVAPALPGPALPPVEGGEIDGRRSRSVIALSPDPKEGVCSASPFSPSPRSVPRSAAVSTGEAASIPLRRRDGSVRAYAVVDTADFDALSQWRWFLGGHGYACRSVREAGRREPYQLLMHRHLLGLAEGDPRECDHINRDKLDNRRANLRVGTHAQNAQNRRAGVGRSGVPCVHERRNGKWMAVVQTGGRSNYLGTYNRIEDAAEAVRVFRAEHFPFSAEALARNDNAPARTPAKAARAGASTGGIVDE